MISVHIVRDEEFSTPDHRVGDDQLSAGVWRGGKKTRWWLSGNLHDAMRQTHSAMRKRKSR